MWIEGSAWVEQTFRVALRHALSRRMLVLVLEGEVGSLSVLNCLDVVEGAVLTTLLSLLGLLSRIPDVPISFVEHWGELGEVHVAIHVDVVRPSGGA